MTARAERRQRQGERVVALRRAVGEKPRPLRAVRDGGQQLGLVVRRRLVADVDAVDALRDVERQRLAEGVAQRRVGAAARLVAGNVEARRPAQAVGEDRVEVRAPTAEAARP